MEERTKCRNRIWRYLTNWVGEDDSYLVEHYGTGSIDCLTMSDMIELFNHVSKNDIEEINKL